MPKNDIRQPRMMIGTAPRTKPKMIAATEGFGRLISGVAGPALIPIVLSNFGVGAVYSLVGSVALIAVVVVFVFGRETHGMTLEQSADPNALHVRTRSALKT